MGRNCCYKSYSCAPCYNPCCPPYFGPCCPPPCNPCAAFCNPCPTYDCCCDSCNTKGSSYFVGSSSGPTDISGQASPYTIDFTEQQDCLCEYVNNTTFIPKCKGYYKFNVSVVVNNTGDTNSSVTVALVVNGVQKSTSVNTVTAGGQLTFTLAPSLYLCKGNSVYVTITPTAFITLGTRTFSGSKCGSSGSSCCSSSCSSCH